MKFENNSIVWTIEDFKIVYNKISQDIKEHDFNIKAFNMDEIDLFPMFSLPNGEEVALWFNVWCDGGTDYIIKCYVVDLKGNEHKFDYSGKERELNHYFDFN